MESSQLSKAHGYTIWLNNEKASRSAIVGGKASNLSCLMRAGFPVPDGYVVLREAFRVFYETCSRRLAKGQDVVEEMRSVPIPEGIASEILRSFGMLSVDRVAVRSSAACEDSPGHSFAGQFETFLNITRRQILDRVRDCWCSAFSERVLAYLEAHQISAGREIEMAVLIQQMIDADVSGVSFTVDPVEGNDDVVLIEACRGLGTSLVAGEITPDVYRVSKKTGQILSREVSRQSVADMSQGGRTIRVELPYKQGNEQKLSDEQIRLLFKLCRKIEDHFGMPQDIEWAVKAGRFHVLQSRPVTSS